MGTTGRISCLFVSLLLIMSLSRPGRFLHTSSTLLCTYRSCSAVSSLAVMSVDLGNEWIKIAIVSPGKPMEIILNSDSSRKTPLAVSFRDGERFFGDAALVTATRFPEKSFDYLMDLVGKKIGHPVVQRHQSHFPFRKMSSHTSKESVVLEHPDGFTFSPEELLAMILESARGYAETAAGRGAKIREVVVTVPPYFTQSERRSVLRAAELAGLHCLQLINSNTAVALNYGVFRVNDFNESSPSNVLFYDMGASSTIASVVSYQVFKTKERGYTERIPTLTVKGVGFDRTLGGLEMQLRLRDALAQKFAESKNIPLDTVKSNKRAMSKLMKEAGRVKKVLSANTEIRAQVENVMNDQDLKTPVTREEFEALSSDLLSNRLIKPVEDALKLSGLSLNDIHHVILFGGNTRVPKVQEVLSKFLGGKELGKSINSDEAAALGAAYQAAYLSKGFKVKQFNVKDVNLLPIQVTFSREVTADEDETEKTVKHMQRTLFGRGNVYPQKKVLTFSKHTNDFDFFVNYADLSSFMTEEDISLVGPLNVSRISLSGVQDVLSKHSTSQTKESKGIKAHFKLDESGIIILDRVEATFEEKVEAGVDENAIADAITRLGNTFGKLFGSSASEDSNVAVDDSVDPSTNATVNATDSSKPEQTSDSTSTNETNVNSTNVNATQTEAKKEIRVKTIKERISHAAIFIDLSDAETNEIEASKKKLADLKSKDEEKLRRDSIRNSLESFITDTKMKLFEEEYEKSSTESEREAISKVLSETSEWLEYESDSAKTEDFKSRLSTIKTSVQTVSDRVREHKERPDRANNLRDMLNISSIFVENMKNLSSLGQQIFTEVEISTLDVMVNETTLWLDESMEKQDKQPLSETPAVSVAEIIDKTSKLDREVKYLINKLKLAPPPTPAPTEAEADSSNKTKKSKKPKKPSTKNETEAAEGGEETLELEGSEGDSKTEQETHSKEEPEPTPVSSTEAPHTEL